MASDYQNLSTRRAQVHVLYDTEPPHPGPSWTRFVCISDTHSRRFQVPAGDVLLHSGDLSSWGEPGQVQCTIDWLRSLPHSTKIIIAGNHDLCLDNSWPASDLTLVGGEASRSALCETLKSQELRDEGFHYLEHESLTIDSPSGKQWKVYGSPATPRYARGAFQYEGYNEAKEIYSKIPRDTEILLTHTPPYRTLDKTKKGSNAGCKHLSTTLDKLKKRRLHVFGHIHEAFGANISSEIVSVNAAISHAPNVVIVDLKEY